MEEGRMELWHMTFESEGRQVLFRGEAALNAAVLTLARVAGRDLLLFSIVDDHIHLAVSGGRSRVGRLSHSLQLALRPLAATQLRTGAHVKAIEKRTHLERLVGYILRQPQHHGLRACPALWTGSCFLDLVGARTVGVLGVPLDAVLPRYRLVQAMPFVGLPAREIVAADNDRVRRAGVYRLAAAAGAVVGAPPGLADGSRESGSARQLTAVLATSAGMSTRDIALALNITIRSAQRRALAPPVPFLLQAVRIRLALEEAVAAAGPPLVLSGPQPGEPPVW
jgi:REP element-mobilizing transposase RayT